MQLSSAADTASASGSKSPGDDGHELQHEELEHEQDASKLTLEKQSEVIFTQNANGTYVRSHRFVRLLV